MRLPLALPLTGVALTALALGSIPAGAASRPAASHRVATWAPVATAAVHPGVQVFTAGAQCTANFVYTLPTGQVLLGQAAHCAGTGGSTETNGCSAKTLPLGTKVKITGAPHPGTIVYSSWVAMQRLHERNASACAYNDLTLIAVHPADVRLTNPSVPVFGGPTGLRRTPTNFGDSVVSYGNSSLRPSDSVLSPKYGVSLGDSAGGWNHSIYTLTPGIPGDSGSGFLDAAGKAFGVLSTVAVAPLPLSNGAGDLAREIAYAQTHGMPGLELTPGTAAFSGAL